MSDNDTGQESWQRDLEAVDSWMRYAFGSWLCDAADRTDFRDFLVERHPSHEDDINCAVMKLEAK